MGRIVEAPNIRLSNRINRRAPNIDKDREICTCQYQQPITFSNNLQLNSHQAQGWLERGARIGFGFDSANYHIILIISGVEWEIFPIFPVIIRQTCKNKSGIKRFNRLFNPNPK